MSIYSPIEATVYGRNENRVKPLFVQHLPLKEGNTLDTDDESPQLFIVGTDLIYYVDGNFYTAATGDSTPSRFGVVGEDDTAAEARNMDMVDNQFFISNSSNLNFSTRDLGGAPSTDDVFFGFHSNPLTGGGFAGMFADRGYVPTSRGTTLRCYFDKILASFTDVSGIADDEYYLPISVNGVFADATHNITVTIPSGGSKFTTVATTAALSALSGANYDYVILHDTGDYLGGYNGTYQYNVSAGEYSATGGGFWKKRTISMLDDGNYNCQKLLAIFNNEISGYASLYSSSKPPIMIVLRNDSGEVTNNAWGGMISSSAAGGAINFKCQSLSTSIPKLELGMVDDSYIFTPYITLARTTTSAILSVPLYTDHNVSLKPTANSNTETSDLGNLIVGFSNTLNASVARCAIVGTSNAFAASVTNSLIVGTSNTVNLGICAAIGTSNSIGSGNSGYIIALGRSNSMSASVGGDGVGLIGIANTVPSLIGSGFRGSALIGISNSIATTLYPTTNGGDGCVAIGNNCNVAGKGAVAIGWGAVSRHLGEVSIGTPGVATGKQQLSILNYTATTAGTGVLTFTIGIGVETTPAFHLEDSSIFLVRAMIQACSSGSVNTNNGFWEGTCILKVSGGTATILSGSSIPLIQGNGAFAAATMTFSIGSDASLNTLVLASSSITGASLAHAVLLLSKLTI